MIYRAFKYHSLIQILFLTLQERSLFVPNWNITLDGLLRNSLHTFRVPWIWFSGLSRSRISHPLKYHSIHKMNRRSLLYIFSHMVIRHLNWNISSHFWCIAIKFHPRTNSVQLTNSTAFCHHLTSPWSICQLQFLDLGQNLGIITVYGWQLSSHDAEVWMEKCTTTINLPIWTIPVQNISSPVHKCLAVTL